jgi:hypothetical protein
MAFTAADLQMVDDHIAMGERHVIQQEELVQRLRDHNLPTDQAELLLEEFRATLRSHRDHRAMMIREGAGRG